MVGSLCHAPTRLWRIDSRIACGSLQPGPIGQRRQRGQQGRHQLISALALAWSTRWFATPRHADSATKSDSRTACSWRRQ